jgi:hypothetical protein
MKQNITKGVLTELIGGFDKFIKINKSDSESMLEYEKIVNSTDFQNLFNKLVDLETEIIQERCISNMNIKLGITKRTLKSGEVVGYVIGRIPYYRPDYVRHQLTVYVGSTEELGNDLDKLKTDKDFMDKVKEQILKTEKDLV